MSGFPAPMRAEAFTGPLGDIALALEPDVEACREALLAELIVFFGNAVGRTAHMQVARTRHHANEFIVLVGQSSRARKGTTRDVAADLVGFADPVWAEVGITSGATSGEGIVSAVRDPTRKRRRATKAEKKDITLTHDIDADGYIEELVDPGVGDKRRVFDEAELSGVFKVAMRDGNTLSERFRKFYDKGTDQIVNKNSPMKATGAHISINGHITREAVRAHLTELDAANGWANRFVYFASRRVRRLPGTIIVEEELKELGVPLGSAIAWAREYEPQLTWGAAAWERWVDFYNALSDDVKGIVGALTARAEAHVMRFALIYAVADKAAEVGLAHLDAALAVWDYTVRSVEWAWEGMHGNPHAERVLRALHAAGATGMARSSLRDLFSHDRKVAVFEEALRFLAEHELAVSRTVPTAGRPAEWWWHRDFAAAPDRAKTGKNPEKGEHTFPYRDFRPSSPGSNGAAMKDPSCTDPEHRSTDWAMPDATQWQCGACHPPSEQLQARGLMYRAGASR